MKNNIDDLGVVGIVVDDWDINNSFKPKTLTTDYSSWICYISRRAVPAGTPITDTYYWKPVFRLDKELAFDYNRFKEHIESIVYSFIQSSKSGVAFDSEFGDRIDIGINQKTITAAFHKLYSILSEITGEVYEGISMIVTPEYFIGENGCIVNIEANTVEANGVFESIAFYWDDNTEPFASNKFVTSFSYTTEIYETKVIKCVAKIMGIEYTEQKTIKHNPSFFLGAGNTYQDLMIDSNWDVRYAIPVSRGAYDVDVAQGQHIIVVIGDSIKSGFIRADINGVEIEFDETTITINGNVYKVFTSVNTYQTEIINVDING